MATLPQPGDVLAFRGRDLVSRAIELATWGPSHVAIVARLRGEVVLVESTTLCKHPCLIRQKPVSGVQVHYLDQRINDYDGRATVYTFRRPWALSGTEVQDLGNSLEWFIGRHDRYDLARAALSAAPLLSWVVNPDPWKVFCSELVASCLMRLGRLPLRNPATYTPATLCRTLRRLGIVRKIEIEREVTSCAA